MSWCHSFPCAYIDIGFHLGIMNELKSLEPSHLSNYSKLWDLSTDSWVLCVLVGSGVCENTSHQVLGDYFNIKGERKMQGIMGQASFPSTAQNWAGVCKSDVLSQDKWILFVSTVFYFFSFPFLSVVLWSTSPGLLLFLFFERVLLTYSTSLELIR